ncbi:MAG: aminotransferase, partial [Actinomycetota bacterium]
MTDSRLEFFEQAELRELTGIKWSRDGSDILPAWVADMDIRTPSVVRDVVAELVAQSDLGYNRKIPESVAPAFARWQQEHHDWTVDPGDLRLFCDVLHAIDTLLWLHTEPGDGIVLLTPIYPPFLKALDG